MSRLGNLNDLLFLVYLVHPDSLSLAEQCPSMDAIELLLHDINLLLLWAKQNKCLFVEGCKGRCGEPCRNNTNVTITL